MAIKLTINGTERTDQIDWESLTLTEVLTKEPDMLEFKIKNYDTKTYKPSLSDEVILYDTDGTTKIFGGYVIETREEVVALIRYLSVRCKDYTHTLDRKLVSKTYTNQTANAIIADIVSTYVESGFTTTNVDAVDVVDKIAFNYLSVSQSLQKLSETLGDYDWYVDPNKDIHFFKEGVRSAPFNLTDTSGNFFWNTLKLSNNTHQIRNKIIIRGGDTIGTSFTDKKIADGTQRTFFVGYNLDSLVVEKALAATPTTFSTLTVGNDGTDSENSYDVLYNPNNGLIRFRDNNKPAINDVVRWTGNPIYPLVTEKSELASIALYGEFQYVIVDKTIKSKDAASQRADAELKKYAYQYNNGTFGTTTSGLKTGQTININSAIRGVNRDYKITRIITKLRTPTTYHYQVDLLASEDVGMVDVLNKLLVKNVSDQIEIGENEVVDRIYSIPEELTMSESYAISVAHNATPETVTLTEVATVQALNYVTDYVLGEFIPNKDGGLPHTGVINRYDLEGDSVSVTDKEGTTDGTLWKAVSIMPAEDGDGKFLRFEGNTLVLDKLTGTDTLPFGKTTHRQVAQSFVATEAWYTTSQLFRKLANTGSATESITLSIQADSGGSPSGTPLASNTVQFSVQPVGSDFNGGAVAYQTTIGQTYWIVLNKATANDTNHYNLAYDSAGVYGTLKVYDGTTWNTVAGTLRFGLYKSGDVALSTNVVLTYNSFSIAWRMRTTATGYQVLFSKGRLPGNGMIEMNASANNLRFESYTNGVYQNNNLTTGITISDGEWHDYALTSGATDMKLYVDGVNTWSKGSALTDAVYQQFRYFGTLGSRLNATYGNPFAGDMAFVRFYNVELSATEVAEIANTHKRQFVLDGSPLA